MLAFPSLVYSQDRFFSSDCTTFHINPAMYSHFVKIESCVKLCRQVPFSFSMIVYILRSNFLSGSLATCDHCLFLSLRQRKKYEKRPQCGFVEFGNMNTHRGKIKSRRCFPSPVSFYVAFHICVMTRAVSTFDT